MSEKDDNVNVPTLNLPETPSEPALADAPQVPEEETPEVSEEEQVTEETPEEETPEVPSEEPTPPTPEVEENTSEDEEVVSMEPTHGPGELADTNPCDWDIKIDTSIEPAVRGDEVVDAINHALNIKYRGTLSDFVKARRKG